MRTRWPIPLMVAGMVIAMAGVAIGKPSCPGHPSCKEEPPDDELVLADVTMTLAGAQGLTTNCDDGDGIGGSIEMVMSSGSLDPVNDPVLGVWMNDVAWNRLYPDPIHGSSGSAFEGCHRKLLDPDEANAVYGGLMIDLDESGAVADILWHFDYWYVWGLRGKKPWVVEFEHFTLSMDETTMTWVDHTPDIYGDTNGTLTADFWMLYHLQGEGYQPLPGSPQMMSFTVIAEPRS